MLCHNWYLCSFYYLLHSLLGKATLKLVFCYHLMEKQAQGGDVSNWHRDNQQNLSEFHQDFTCPFVHMQVRL